MEAIEDLIGVEEAPGIETLSLIYLLCDYYFFSRGSIFKSKIVELLNTPNDQIFKIKLFCNVVFQTVCVNATFEKSVCTERYGVKKKKYKRISLLRRS